MDAISHLDVLPADDLGIRNGFAVAFGTGEPSRTDIETRGRRWRPCRRVASWHLGRAAERVKA